MDGMQESGPWKQLVMVTCLQKGSAYRNEAWRIRCGLLSQRATGASEELRPLAKKSLGDLELRPGTTTNEGGQKKQKS